MRLGDNIFATFISYFCGISAFSLFLCICVMKICGAIPCNILTYFNRGMLRILSNKNDPGRCSDCIGRNFANLVGILWTWSEFYELGRDFTNFVRILRTWSELLRTLVRCWWILLDSLGFLPIHSLLGGTLADPQWLTSLCVFSERIRSWRPHGTQRL